MKDFIIMMVAIFLSIGFLYVSRKRTDEDFSLKNLSKICGIYIEQSQIKTSRGNLFKFIVLDSNAERYKFALSDRTILKINKIESGDRICVSYGKTSILDSKVAFIID